MGANIRRREASSKDGPSRALIVQVLLCLSLLGLASVATGSGQPRVSSSGSTGYVPSVSSSVVSTFVSLVVHPFGSSLTASPPTPNAPSVDLGQTLTLTANASGGTQPYSYQWYAGVFSQCQGNSVISGATGPAYTFVPSSSLYYCYNVTDSSSPRQIVVSATDLVTVNPALVAGEIEPLFPVIRPGGSVTLVANASGGTPPYAYQWYATSFAACPGGSAIPGATALTLLASPATTTWYCFEVTDASVGAPTGIVSRADLVNVTLVAGSVTPGSPRIDLGQAVTLSASPTGGTPPYSYQWHSGTSTICSDDPTIVGATSATFLAAPTANTSYCYVVTDSSNPTGTAASVVDGVTVDPALVAGLITPAAPAISFGQSVDLTAHLSGGTPPYSYQWYGGASPVCSNNAVIAGATGSTYLASPAASSYLCYQGTDASVGTRTAVASATDLVTVTLTAGAVTPGSPMIDSGQTVMLTANPTGGTPPYTFQWYSGSANTCSGDTAGPGAISAAFDVAPTANTSYCYVVTDSAGPPGTSASAVNWVTVDPPLQAGAITPPSPAIDEGRSVTLTATPSGGTAPYLIQWYAGMGEGCADDAAIEGATSLTYVASPSNGTYYCYSLTDSSPGFPIASEVSSTDWVTVNAALSAGPVTPVSPVLSLGGSVALTANPSNGTPPFAYQWYAGTSAFCASDPGVPGATGRTFQVSPTSNTYYCYAVTDASVSPSTVLSGTDLVAVGPAVSTVTVGSAPVAVVYDPINGNLYEANSGSGTVGVLDASGSMVATIPVGSEPCALAVNSTDGNIYVANFGSNNVTVIDGATEEAIAAIPVGTNPYALAFDGYNGLLYVANYGSGDVSVINAASDSVTATVPIGPRPTALAVDPANGEVYVLNGTDPFLPLAASGGNDNVTVISGGSLVTLVPVGRNPDALAYDAVNGKFYVSNFGSSNVSVIWGSNNTVNASVAIASPEAVAYDAVNYDVYVVGVGPGSTSDLYRISSASNQVVAVIPLDPVALAASPVNGNVYAVNSAAATVSVVSGSTNSVIATVAVGSGPTAVAVNTATGTVFVTDEAASSVSEIPAKIPTFYPVLFEESGLPSGALWSVDLGGSVLSTTGMTLTFSEENGSYAFTTGAPSGYTGPSGARTVVVSGALVIETLTFTALPPTRSTPTYEVVVTEAGLPTGTRWSIEVAGISYSSATNAIVFDLVNGSYTYTVSSSDPSFASAGGSFAVRGTPVSVLVTFSPTSTATFAVTFTESGLPSGTEWYVNITGESPLSSSGTMIATSLSDGSYRYTVASGNRAYSGPSGGFTVNNSTVSVSIAFIAIPSATVTFTESGLASGTTWYVNVSGGPSLTSSGRTATTTLASGAYRYTVGVSVIGKKDYSAAGGTFTMSGAAVDVSLMFMPVRAVTFTEKGLPAGTEWWVNVTGGASTSSSGTTLRVYEPRGAYAYTVASVDKSYGAKGGLFTVHTGPVKVAVKFALVTYGVTFTESGLPSGSKWCVAVAEGGAHCTTKTIATIAEPNGTYSYTVSTTRRGYTGVAGTFTVDGSAVSVSVPFSSGTGVPAVVASAAVTGGPLGGAAAVLCSGMWTVWLIGAGLVLTRRGPVLRTEREESRGAGRKGIPRHL